MPRASQSLGLGWPRFVHLDFRRGILGPRTNGNLAEAGDNDVGLPAVPRPEIDLIIPLAKRVTRRGVSARRP